MQAPLSIPVIAVVGSRHSGKTATVETVVRGLTKKGYRVATAKHIHDINFTIDTEGRDTWRHTKAGAHITLAVSASELATINKLDTSQLTLSDITKHCEDKTEVIVLEGFRGLIDQDLTVPKIVTAKNKQEIEEATQVFKPILAFTTMSPKAEFKELKTPPVDIKKETEKLIQIIDQRINPIITKRRETTVSTSIDINGKPLPLNPYVQKITRNVLLAILSTLKGTQPTGNENIQIKITTPNKPTS
ncbi:MAG TPA: molybdopterin-guanine dinucleotide biosynthesis protein B [Candidatus Bathyarchaeia archaeon]|nr:molybdopterin-guanine dinucleotide biosynthesis protein B [Candidatus Bathyarchaeia archaeon]